MRFKCKRSKKFASKLLELVNSSKRVTGNNIPPL